MSPISADNLGLLADLYGPRLAENLSGKYIDLTFIPPRSWNERLVKNTHIIGWWGFSIPLCGCLFFEIDYFTDSWHTVRDGWIRFKASNTCDMISHDEDYSQLVWISFHE